MRILFISTELLAGNLAFLLQKEGCEVKLFIKKKELRENFDNIVTKTTNWKKELKWVGKDGLIIFDDVDYGKIQNQLRAKGYSVFGGSELGDKLENDREWAQEILKKNGLLTLPTYNFETIKDAMHFASKNSGPWVIKQNGHAAKDINYVGYFEDNSDVISVLENYKKNYGNNLGKITLQKKVLGVEIGVGRFFNGKEWVGPIEINVEHKRLFPGDLGPNTSEMGTLAWYDEREGNKIFQATLAKLKSFLRQIDFRGDIDLNCIVNKSGIYILEVTPRLGCPILHLQNEIHISPWNKFLKAIADQRPFDLEWRKGFGIVMLISAPPFPYESNNISSVGLNVCFHSSMTENDFDHIHFEGISFENNQEKERFYISDNYGHILYISSLGKTIREAREKAANIAKKIHIPKMFYRNDIGVKFEVESLIDLKKWGYLDDESTTMP